MPSTAGLASFTVFELTLRSPRLRTVARISGKLADDTLHEGDFYLLVHAVNPSLIVFPRFLATVLASIILSTPSKTAHDVDQHEADALGKDVGDAAGFHDGADRAAGDDAGAGAERVSCRPWWPCIRRRCHAGWCRSSSGSAPCCGAPVDALTRIASETSLALPKPKPTLPARSPSDGEGRRGRRPPIRPSRSC